MLGNADTPWNFPSRYSEKKRAKVGSGDALNFSSWEKNYTHRKFVTTLRNLFYPSFLTNVTINVIHGKRKEKEIRKREEEPSRDVEAVVEFIPARNTSEVLREIRSHCGYLFRFRRLTRGKGN